MYIFLYIYTHMIVCVHICAYKPREYTHHRHTQTHMHICVYLRGKASYQNYCWDILRRVQDLRQHLVTCIRIGWEGTLVGLEFGNLCPLLLRYEYLEVRLCFLLPLAESSTFFFNDFLPERARCVHQRAIRVIEAVFGLKESREQLRNRQMLRRENSCLSMIYTNNNEPRRPKGETTCLEHQKLLLPNYTSIKRL